MSTIYEKAVTEDFHRGHGSVSVSMPGGGSATGSKFGIHSLLDTTLNLRDFCAIHTGTLDVTTALPNAIAALDTGGTLIVPSGTYHVNASAIDLASGRVRLIGEPGATLSITPSSAQLRGILMGVGPSTDRAISGTSIAAGATSFTAAGGGASDLVANDWVLVYIYDPTYGDAVAIDFVQVASKAGAVITLQKPFPHAFTPVGSQTVLFQHMGVNGTPCRDVEIAGLTIELDASEMTEQSSALSIYWGRNVWVHHNVFKSTVGSSAPGNWLSLFRSQHVSIHDNQFIVAGSGTSAGIVELANSVDVQFTRNSLRAEAGSSATTQLAINFGLNRYSVTDNDIRDTTDFGIVGYAHPYDGIIAHNKIGLVSGQKKGISLIGGTHNIIAHNTLLGPSSSGGTGIVVGDDSNASATLTSTGNLVHGNKVGTSISFTTEYSVANSGDRLANTEAYTEGTWTPTASNLTQAGGSATLAGRYIKLGKLVFFSITVTPVTSTSSVANSTNLTLPFTPVAVGSGFGVATSEIVASFGESLIHNSGVLYTPTWTTVVNKVFISGSFYAVS